MYTKMQYKIIARRASLELKLNYNNFYRNVACCAAARALIKAFSYILYAPKL